VTGQQAEAGYRAVARREQVLGGAERVEDVDAAEIQQHLEQIARSDDTSASTRVRALEVLLRLAKTATPDDIEWAKIVQRFGTGHE
jgi:hypothetical protein